MVEYAFWPFWWEYAMLSAAGFKLLLLTESMLLACSPAMHFELVYIYTSARQMHVCML